MKQIKIIANIGIIIALYFLVYYLYTGYLHPLPLDGDSWDYHIPISETILDGSFLSNPHNTIQQQKYFDTSLMVHSLPPWLHTPLSLNKMSQWYYPGSSEIINAIFLLFHIPTFSNIFAAIALFFVCWKLALTFRLPTYYALLFALTFSTLNVILRWLNVVSIDIWLCVWFGLSMILLENPKKTLTYFAKLGFVLGMFMGSKYTAIYFSIPLLILYMKSLSKYVNALRFLMFLIPFSVFGLFWYIRNYTVTGNPIYPLPRLGFKGPLAFDDTVWIETLHHPLKMLNAGFGEYHLWLFSILIALAALFYQYIIKRKFEISNISKLFIIGLFNFIFYFNFPTSAQVWIMVSSFRYSLPAFLPLMLGVFMLAARHKKEELVGYVVIASMINTLTMAYYPKLILVYLPASLVIFYFVNNIKHNNAIKKTTQ